MSGPVTQPSIYDQSSSQIEDVFGQYPGPSVDAAVQLVSQFMALVGWPKDVNTIDMAGDLLKYVPSMNPTAANDALYNMLPGSEQQANPWAKYGLDRDKYQAQVKQTQAEYSTLSGHQMDGSLLDRAMREQWTTQNMTNYLGYGDPSGPGVSNLPSQADLTNSPWLASGTSYDNAHSQFISQMGRAPVSNSELAEWYRTVNQGTLGNLAQADPWLAEGMTTVQARQQFYGAMGRGPKDDTELTQWYQASKQGALNDLGQQNPWLAYGQTYVQAQQQYLESVGEEAGSPGMVADWYLYAHGADAASDVAALLKSDPWLAQGETFSQVRQQYQSSVGSLPTGRDQIASWWSMNQSARQVGSSRGSGIVGGGASGQGPASDSEVR